MKIVFYLQAIFLILMQCAQFETEWTGKFCITKQGDCRISDLLVLQEIYVVGTYFSEEHSPRCITAQFSKDGEIDWYSLYESPTTKASEGKTLLVSHDAVYVLLQVADSNNLKETILVRYDKLGKLIWKKTIEKTEAVIFVKMLFDNSGNIYIAGWSNRGNGLNSLFIDRLRDSGELLWRTEYTNPDISFNQLKFEVVKPSQFLIGGILQDARDLFFLRYDSLGQFSDLVKYETPENENFLAEIKTDDNDNVYLTGASKSDASANDYLTVVYDRNNNLLWAKRFDGPKHLDDIPRNMMLDESVNVYVAGSQKSENERTDIVTIKYDTRGNQLWTKTYKARNKRSAEPYFLEPDFIRSGRYVVKTLRLVGTAGDDIVLIKYNIASGNTVDHIFSAGKGETCTPLAFSRNCIGIECSSEKESESVILKYRETEPFGFARWD